MGKTRGCLCSCKCVPIKDETIVNNCWFARDVTAAMLVVKNKSISLLWELNSVFIFFFEEIFFCFDPQHGRLVTRLQTKN